jgi:hypothetical protein
MPNIESLSALESCPDRIVPWPIALAYAFPLALIAIWTGPFDVAFAAVPVLLVIWAATALGAMIMALRSARSRLWRRTLSLSALPIVAAALAANAGTVWPLATEMGERLHFLLLRHSYLDEVTKLPASAEPRFAMWLRGGFMIGHGIAYDESDEILLAEQTPAWKMRVASTEVGMCGAWGTRLEGHFYLIRTGC